MLHHLKKILYLTSIFFLYAGAMDQSTPPGYAGQRNPNPSHPYTALQFKTSASRSANLSFISFERAKIRANAAQLLREIPTLSRTQNEIYSPEQASEIIQTALKNFGGNEQAVPVSGFLETLELLEKIANNSKSLHGLVNHLYELERANDLIKTNHVIKGFRTKIQLPSIQNNAPDAKQHPGISLDIEICAENENGQMVLEKLKAFQFGSLKTLQGTRGVIDSLNRLAQSRGITCRLHSKFTMPTDIQDYARDKGIIIECDSPKLISLPQDMPTYPTHPIRDLIDPDKIKIDVPNSCIVCYEEVTPERAQFTRDLEAAHIEYLNANLDQDVPHYPVRSWINKFAAAKKRFSLVPGFLNTILIPCVARMEEKKWCNLRTVLFELMGAFDAPQEKEVVAFGAELFYDEKNAQKPAKAPSFAKGKHGYTYVDKANVGFDLDVLMREKAAPTKYSFIEATTGPSSVKCLEKFQSMGRALNAEVFVLHDFEEETFERTAFWKHPACITLPNNTDHLLAWPLACRTQACLQQVCAGKNVYNPVQLALSKETLDEFTHVYNELIKRHYTPEHNHPICASAVDSIKNTPHIFDDLPSNIARIFKLIDDTSRQADEDVFKLKIHAGIEKLLMEEKENQRPGSLAFAVLVMNQLNCTIQDQKLRERYLATNHQYQFDINTVLRDTLNAVVKKAHAAHHVLDIS